MKHRPAEHRTDEIPSLSLPQFEQRLASRVPTLSGDAIERLHRHYEELRTWNERLGLIGPGTFATIVERHYGESLAALPWLDRRPGARSLLDVGSGAGFPGIVLAICRPALRVTLLESTERKAAFLRRSARAAGADVSVLAGFLRDALPAGAPETLDFVTLRAVKLAPAGWHALRARLAPDGLLLQWSGPAMPAPEGFQEVGPAVPLAGGDRRSIRAWSAASGERKRAQGPP